MLLAGGGPGWRQQQQVWARQLHGGAVAVGLLNLDETAVDMEFDLVDVCDACSHGATALDVWDGSHTEIKTDKTYVGHFQTTVKPHEAVLLRLQPRGA